MRRRSVSGPLLLLLIGGLFLWRNLHPEVPVFEMVARYWPFLLIAWGVLRLVEVLFWRRQGYASFTGGEVALVVLICIVGSGLWQAREHGLRFNTGGLEVFGEQFDFPVSANAPSTGVKRITLENLRGNIKIAGSDEAQVTITGHKTIRAWARKDAEDTDKKTPVEIVQEGDRLLIRTNQDRAPDNQRMSDDLEISVPRTVVVETRGRTNDLDIADINADLEINSDRADVRLARIGGNVRLDLPHSELVRALDVKGKIELQGSRGSDVDLENVAGQVTISGTYTGTLEFKNLAKPLQYLGSQHTELHAQSVPGRITMDLSEVTANGVTGPVRLVTRSRDVKMERFTQSLELETERGDITLQPSVPVPSIEARSGNGRIDLILPEKATFDLLATAERGEAFNGYGSPIQQDREGRTATLKGKSGDGPAIRLTANRGSVSVRKEGTPAGFEGTPDENPRPPKPPKTPRDLKDSEIRM